MHACRGGPSDWTALNLAVARVLCCRHSRCPARLLTPCPCASRPWQALLAPAAPRTIKQVAPKPVQYVKAAPLARKAKGHPQQAVRYVKAQGHPQQAVRYVKVPAHYVEERVRAPPRRVEKRIVHGKVEYVMVPAQMHRGRRGLRRQELRIGAKGVRRGVMLDDEEEPAEGDEEEAPAEDGEGEEGEGEEGEGEEGEGEEEGDAEEAADEAPAAVVSHDPPCRSPLGRRR